MPRRVLITSALVALLLGLAALAPGLPPVRRALLDRATQLLAGSGLELDYRAAEGNAWRRVALNGVTLEGLGSEVQVDRVELRYFLPSLLGGELPLDVTLRGVRGDVDLSDLEELVEQAAAGDGGGGLAPRVVLREVDVSDIDLRVQNVPFTLPDATLSDLRLEPEPGGLQVGARVTTADGELEAEGRLALPSYDFAGTVRRADVSVARHWWPGAVAGTVSGPISVRRGHVNAELSVVGGVVEQAGVRVTDVTGRANLAYPLITAELRGRGLEGPVTVSGTVDVARRLYDVTARATPDLAAAGGWLAALLGLEEAPVAVSGSAEVQARVRGWQRPAIDATATGAGSLGGLPLEALSASVSLGSGNGSRGSLVARLGEGGLNATLAPGPQGDRHTSCITS